MKRILALILITSCTRLQAQYWIHAKSPVSVRLHDLEYNAHKFEELFQWSIEQQVYIRDSLQKLAVDNWQIQQKWLANHENMIVYTRQHVWDLEDEVRALKSDMMVIKLRLGYALEVIDSLQHVRK
jgi:hypothetical protein